MKIKTILAAALAFAATGIFAAESSGSASEQSATTNAPAKVKLPRGMRRYGGIIQVPNSQKGTIVIVNAQKKLPLDKIRAGMDEFAQTQKFNVKFVDGEMLVKGDNLFSGYYKDPARTAEAFTEDGWFRTGDLCRMDDEGFVYITGRIKNLIILPNGENVSPESLEEPFYADPCVRDAMVKEDELNGTQVIAIEILPFMPAFDGKPFEEVEAYMNALVDKVNATLPSTHQIRKVTVRTEDFKRTGSMKVARV